MKREEFEKELSKKLSHFPQEEQQKALDYYYELFYDRLERGEAEEEIIASFGSPEEIASRISGETVFTKTTRKVKEKVTKTTLGVTATIKRIFTNKSFLIFYFSAFIITFPLTMVVFSVVLSLGMAALGIALGLGITAFAIVFSIAACVFAFMIAGPLYMIFGPISAGGFNSTGLALFGCGLALIALGIAFYMLLRTLDYLRILVFVKRENKPKAYSRVNKGNIFLKLSIITCIVFVAGGSVFTAGFAMTDFNIRKLDTAEYTSINTVLPDTIDKVSLNTKSRDITIVAVAENFRVEGYSNNESKLKVDVVGNELVITETFKFEFMQMFNLFRAVNWKKENVKIYLPADINVLDVNATSGDLALTNISASEINIKVTSGDIEMTGVVAQKVTVKVTSGESEILSCNIKTLTITAFSGDVDIRALTANSVDVKTTSGEISVRIIGNPENYHIESKVSSGDNHAKKHNRLDTIAEANGYYVKLRAASGDIRLSFLG